MFKLSKHWLAVMLVAIFCLPLAAWAGQDMMSDNYHLAQDQVVNQTLLKAGESLIIEGQVKGDVILAGGLITLQGDIDGDVYLAGANLTLNGSVHGNVYAVGSNIAINGPVTGSVWAAGNNVVVNSQVGKNANLFGANVILGEESQVAWDASGFGAAVSFNGRINRHANLFGAALLIAGQVDGDVYAEMEEEGSLSLSPQAVVQGNLTYKAVDSQQLSLHGSAQINGQTSYVPLDTQVIIGQQQLEAMIMSFLASIWLVMFLGCLAVGILYLILFNKLSTEMVVRMKQEFWSTLGWGTAVFFVTPFILFILMMTVIGLPLSFILLGIYCLLFYLGTVMASMAVGDWIIKKTVQKDQVHLIWKFMLGLVLINILTLIPWIGWLFRLIMILWGMGGLVVTSRLVYAKIK